MAVVEIADGVGDVGELVVGEFGVDWRSRLASPGTGRASRVSK